MVDFEYKKVGRNSAKHQLNNRDLLCKFVNSKEKPTNKMSKLFLLSVLAVGLVAVAHGEC